jgi:hypothetical protein
MQLPALKNSTALSTDGQSVEEYIRNATKNMQKVAAAMPGSGTGVTGAVFLNFNGNNGNWTLSKEVVDPKSLGRIVVLEHGLFEGMIEWANGSALQKIPASVTRRHPHRANDRSVAAEAVVARGLSDGHRRPEVHDGLCWPVPRRRRHRGV